MSFCESEHPLASTVAPSAVSAQVSKSSFIPSPSVSFCESEQPFVSTVAPSGVSAQVSLSSITPSLSPSVLTITLAVLVIESLAVITVITASPLAIAVTIPS